MDRRQLLQGLPIGLLASLAPVSLDALYARTTPDAKRPLAALLLPLSGEGADLGRSMAHAGGLAQPADTKDTGKNALLVFDTQGTAAGAATATRAALKAGAPLLLGPLYAREMAAVAEAAGDVPVLSFSNDSAAARGRAYLFGITAGQAVEAVLTYARARGVRRVALIADPSGWGVQAGAAARQLAGDIGIEVVAATQASWRSDPLPDAVLVSGGGPQLGAAAREFSAAGVQVLATLQATELPSRGLAALDGAWLTAPDPERFADFARSFEGKYGNTPGVIAGLAYDAVNIARALRRAGHVDRDGLLAPTGFSGVTGTVRFARDGSAARELAVMVVEGGSLRVVERGQAG